MCSGVHVLRILYPLLLSSQTKIMLSLIPATEILVLLNLLDSSLFLRCYFPLIFSVVRRTAIYSIGVLIVSLTTGLISISRNTYWKILKLVLVLKTLLVFTSHAADLAFTDKSTCTDPLDQEVSCLWININ